MREDRSLRIPTKNQTLLFVTPLVLIFLIIAACLWAATLPTASKLNKPIKGGEEKAKASDDDQIEIVVPHKSWPPPLVEHDLMYDTPSIAAESLRRHHSGHYRRKLADIWDPHPQYEFTAFGKFFHLQLQLNSEFTIPHLQVTKLWANMSIRENPNLNPNGCFYTGTVEGDPLSSVAVNLCHGITGHIRTSDASYLIEPAEPYKDHDTPIKHSITRISSFKSPHPSQNDLCHVLDNANRTKEINVEMNKRRKRSLSREYFIELMVVTDKKMVDFHGAGLQHYILTLMAVVTQIFKDASIGHLITVAVVKYYELNESNMDHIFGLPRNKVGPTSSHEMLSKFCNWQRDINFFDDDTHANHHDAAVFLTKENICRAPFTENCDTLGLAEVGTMCDKKSCAIIRDNGLAAAFTIAHELGHLLSMPHDDDMRCSNLNMDVVHKVMSRIMDNNTYPWAWSECSRYFLTEFLDAGYGSCMLDHPLNDLQREETYILPGENFTLNKQCQLLYGNKSSYCPRPEPMCKRLWCTPERKISNVVCVTQHLPMADGTLCGDKHWCQKGECVVKDRNALRRIHGGWGSWGVYTRCSRSCGGGVQQAERLCNNPVPLNGGRYCIGRRIKYRSCNTHECPTNKDFRAEQCAKYNNNNLKIVGVPEDVKWVPKYTGIASEEKCKLYCRVQNSRSYYILADKVVDGTVCGSDTFDICVNGVCQQAGCDHKLNSSLQLDYCGKCGGDNSTCQQVNGTYSLSQYGYSTVVRIPAGSSNLDIRQIGYGDSNKDDNYLALADENDEFILNGDHFVSMFRKLILYGGTTLEYTGSDAVVERINSSRPLNKDLIVKVLSVGNLHQPNIVYDYTIQKSSLAQFSWELSKEWSYCDKVCNGYSRKEVTCVRKVDREKVDLFFCQELQKPVSPPTPCNNHCTLMWEVTSRSECSSHCGPGTRSLSFQCVQFIRTPTKKRVPIDNSSCADLPRPLPTEDCTGPCDEARWVFTPWGPCSKTCGEGIQRRNASCVDELHRQRNESDCRQSEKKIERICSLEKCPQWGFGDWSPCSVTCGTGYRRRPYWCHSENLQVNTHHCNNLPVPHHLTLETCVLDPCPQWIPHEWSQCSVSCGVGQQVRIVECSVPGRCPLNNKPETIQACTMEACSLRHENALPDVRRFIWKTTPWSHCSVTCGQGVKWRDVECYDDKMGKKVKDSQECLLHLPPVPMHDICFAPRCPTWEIGQWGPCSVTCDQGIESRDVHCVSHTGSYIDESYCNNRPRPESERICMVSTRCRTPVWKTSPWSQCSVSCGGGYRTRTITCESENKHCPQSVPPSKESCNLEPCSKGTWVIDKWSQCSKTCGDTGLRFRSVRCKSSTGDNLPDEACGGNSVKPLERTECHNNPPCHKPILYDWQHTRHWSPCSKTCGKGVRQRKVWCAKSSGHRVPDSECAASRKPKSVKECQRAPCPFDWAPRPWSQCSVTCGQGFKTRTVQCYGYKAAGQVAVDDSYCKNSAKPPVRQECIMNACPKNYRWVPGPWGQCSERCSRAGFQKRKLFCYLGNTKLKKHTLCFKIQKPKRRQKCPIDKCENCMELQRNSNRRKDGEYKLLVYDRVLSVFCHGMETVRPKEYITLHFPRENYAEIYDKRLRNPDSCPQNGQRTHPRDCRECITDYKPNVGFTYFEKIRVNLTTLLVDVRDWTYANVVKGGRVPFGEAGDCYSRASCPQGQFRINLEKTGFKVSRQQQWISDGEYSHHKVQKYEEGIKVEGICGGYCGICRPLRGLKLDVLPP